MLYQHDAVENPATNRQALDCWTPMSRFPDAIQILDRCHAKQHLNDVANAIYGKGTPEAEQWASQRKKELDDEQLEELLAALGQHAGTCKDAKTCVGYVERNRHRMRYKEFHAMELCTTSNIVESGCKVIFTTRFKHSAMHWSVLGANKILAIRCYKRSGRLEDSYLQPEPCSLPF